MVTQSQSLSLTPCPSGFHGNKLANYTHVNVLERGRSVFSLCECICVCEREIAYGSSSMCMSVSLSKNICLWLHSVCGCTRIWTRAYAHAFNSYVRVCVCVWWCMGDCLRICMCAWICILSYVYASKQMYKLLEVCLCLSLCVHSCLHKYAHMWLFADVAMCVCLFV